MRVVFGCIFVNTRRLDACFHFLDKRLVTLNRFNGCKPFLWLLLMVLMKRVKDADVVIMLSMYSAGSSTAEISARVGFSKKAVRYWLAKAGMGLKTRTFIKERG